MTGGAVAAALLMLNPDVLYLQSTPMTEPLLFGTTFLRDRADRRMDSECRTSNPSPQPPTPTSTLLSRVRLRVLTIDWASARQARSAPLPRLAGRA